MTDDMNERLKPLFARMAYDISCLLLKDPPNTTWLEKIRRRWRRFYLLRIKPLRPSCALTDQTTSTTTE